MASNFNETNIALINAYKPKGTHKGVKISVGEGNIQTSNTNNKGITIGNLYSYVFCPTYDDDAFKLFSNSYTVAAGATVYLPLTTITPPAGKVAYMKKEILNGYQVVKLDIPRPITIWSDQPFTANISGFDRYKNKCNNEIVSEAITGGNQATTIRAFEYLGSISFTNTSGSEATVKIILDKIIEIPYLQGSLGTFNFVWGWVSNTDGSNFNSIPYATSSTGNLIFTGGSIQGGISGDFIANNSIYLPIFTNKSQPTETDNGPRPMYSLAGNVSGEANLFLWDQKEVYTMYFAYNNPYENTESVEFINQHTYTDQYQTTINQQQIMLGLKNYADSNWYALKN